MATTDKPTEDKLLARAFLLLLKRGVPVAPEELGEEAALDALNRAGRLRRDPSGRIVAAHGLSVVPSRHELELSGRRFWTWCAYDAFGITGALKADATLRTHDPVTGQRREVSFVGGAPGSEGFVFLPKLETCSSVFQEWCPHANVFATVEEADRWSENEGVPGEAVTFLEASRRGAELWRAVINEDHKPTEATHD